MYHHHILGASGKGKSKYLEHIIRGFLLKRQGFALIDPHGELSDNVLRYIETKRLNRDITYFTDRSGFDLLNFPDIHYGVDSFVNACATVWAEDSMKTPALRQALRMLAYALSELSLPFSEALSLCDFNSVKRFEIARRLTDPFYRDLWDQANTMTNRQHTDLFSSARRRLIDFLATPSLREMFSRPGHDIRAIMDKGGIFIADLSGMSNTVQRTLGTLLVNDMYLKSLHREHIKPYPIIIDEAWKFLTPDIESMLVETRKFGVFLFLAHQQLSQLPPAIHSAILTNTHKVIFGGLTPNDARTMAEMLYAGNLVLDEVKRERKSGGYGYRDVTSFDQEGRMSTTQNVIESSDTDNLPAFFSLEEQWYKAASYLVNLPVGNAVIKDPSLRLYTVPIIERAFANDARLERMKTRLSPPVIPEKPIEPEQPLTPPTESVELKHEHREPEDFAE